jgi:hypothetical protein
MSKILAVAFVIVCVVGLIGCPVAYQFGVGVNDVPQVVDRYNEGYASGLDAGDSQGYSRGLSDGASSGYGQGYSAGYANGTADAPKPSSAPDRYSEGYDAGLASGKSAGYNDGYSKGTLDGFNGGYSVGYVNGSKDGAGSGYNIRDPTYSEMQSFIAVDQTDKNTYSTSYDCHDFTRDVLVNAFNSGLKGGYVYVEFAGELAHALVCFDTVDRGLVFIEPQSDDVVTVAVGIHYWDRAIYEEPEYDDTIIQFDIIW